MLKIHVRFRPSKRRGNYPGRLTYRLILNRQSREIATHYRIQPSLWDSRNNSIRLPPNKSSRRNELDEIIHHLQSGKQELLSIYAKQAKYGFVQVDDVKQAYLLSRKGNSFFHFVEHLASELYRMNKDRTAKAYHTAKRRLIAFNKGKDFSLDDIDAALIRGFESSLREEGLRLNSISFHIRNLRAIYNKAVRRGRITAKANVFSETYTGVETTRKRALDKDEVAALMNLQLPVGMTLPDNPTATRQQVEELNLAQDLFAFSFQARGMSFVDMAFLKKENIKEGIISYHRRKTGQLLEIGITPQLATLINKYKAKSAGTNSQYLFPIIQRESKQDILNDYSYGLKKQNQRLKTLAALAGIKKQVTTHVARHSWATIAKNESVPIWLISEGLGHNSLKTTYIYLASFDQSRLDEANAKVLLAVGA